MASQMEWLLRSFKAGNLVQKAQGIEEKALDTMEDIKTLEQCYTTVESKRGIFTPEQVILLMNTILEDVGVINETMKQLVVGYNECVDDYYKICDSSPSQSLALQVRAVRLQLLLNYNNINDVLERVKYF